MNGVQIGMERIIIPQVRLVLRRALLQVSIGCFGAVRGATLHRFAVLLIAAASFPGTAATFTASVLLFPSKNPLKRPQDTAAGEMRSKA